MCLSQFLLIWTRRTYYSMLWNIIIAMQHKKQSPVYLNTKYPSPPHINLQAKTQFKIKNIYSLSNRKLKTQCNESAINTSYNYMGGNFNQLNSSVGMQMKQKVTRKGKENLNAKKIYDGQDSSGEEIDVQRVRLLGVYRVGGNSVVYKGVVGGISGMEVIVKKIPIDLDHKSRQEYFAKCLNSPYIAQCLGTYHTQEPSKAPQPTPYLNLVMKKYNNNLDQILQVDNLQPIRVKIFLYQMFRSLVYLHSLNICHRDIKTHNFVIKNNIICLCDFGSAKVITKNRDKNNDDVDCKSVVYIFQRQYRAPELLFGYQSYNEKVDIWALGCVAAEMVLKKPLFNGVNNLDQIVKILKVLGTPKWSNLSFCKGRIPKLPQIIGSGIKQALGHKSDPLLVDLLSKLLRVQPNDRISALEALCEPYFDQIRDQSFYRNNLRSTNIPNLYYFTKKQITGKQQLLTKLIPYWIKEHCKRFQIKIQDYKF